MLCSFLMPLIICFSPFFVLCIPLVQVGSLYKSVMECNLLEGKACSLIFSGTCDQSFACSVGSGTVDDECDISHDNRNWYEYWRLLFARVSEADIEEFEKTYRGRSLFTVE